MKSVKPPILIVVLLLAGSTFSFIGCSHTESRSVEDHERKVCLAEDDRDHAKYALDTLSKTMNGVPDLKWQTNGAVVRYTFLDAWWKEEHNPPLHLAIHNIADYDACLQGYARQIEFYSEHGDRLGYAEAEHGVNILVNPGWTPAAQPIK